MHYTLEIDCRTNRAPREGDTFTLRDQRYEVIYVVKYDQPQLREPARWVTHHIRYRAIP